MDRFDSLDIVVVGHVTQDITPRECGSRSRGLCLGSRRSARPSNGARDFSGGRLRLRAGAGGRRDERRPVRVDVGDGASIFGAQADPVPALASLANPSRRYSAIHAARAPAVPRTARRRSHPAVLSVVRAATTVAAAQGWLRQIEPDGEVREGEVESGGMKAMEGLRAWCFRGGPGGKVVPTLGAEPSKTSSSPGPERACISIATASARAWASFRQSNATRPAPAMRSR